MHNFDKRTKLSQHELAVLRRGSKINSRDYVPFFYIDLRERFAFQTPFVDKHGPLKLAPKQEAHFSRWAQPDEIMSEPKMIMALSYFAIKQDLISDCSFVASLAVSVQYEKKFTKRLITSIIYPQNKQGFYFIFHQCHIRRKSRMQDISKILTLVYPVSAAFPISWICDTCLVFFLIR